MPYQQPLQTDWNGRVDSTTNYDAFRWHQWIKMMPLDKGPMKALNQTNQLNIGFIGFACDEGIRLNKGRQGAALGPKMIRKELSNLPCLFTQAVQLFDCGDIHVQGHQLADLQQELSTKITQMLEIGLFPVVLGGGHELALGHYNGLTKKHPHIGIINLDAHLDMRPYDATASSGTMFRQIADANIAQNQPFRYLCLGVQRRGNTVDLLKKAKQLGANYLYARDIIHSPINDTITVINDFIAQQDSIYLTLCSDVIASAYAPGVSASQPLGLHPELVLDLIKTVIYSGKMVAFDVAEVSPRFDQDNVTANLACTYIFALVNELADLHHMAVKV